MFAVACGAPAEDQTQSSLDETQTPSPSTNEATPAPSEASEAAADPNSNAPSRALALIDRSTLESCTREHSDVEVDEQLQIAVALHDSVHELVACGGMTITIAATLIAGVANAIIAGTTSFEPRGVRYEGEGRYVAPTGLDGEGTLTVRFWQEGSDGATLIEDDLFDLNAYLKGARMASGIDSGGAFVQIAFDEPGPWVELLGWGQSPTSPVRLRGNDLVNFAPKLDDIRVSSDVLVDDAAGNTVVSYSVTSEPMPLDEVVYVGNIDYELLGISAQNTETMQTAASEVVAWDIAFGEAALTGSAAFRIEGGLFDFGLYYGHSPDHSDDIVVSCAE